MTDNLLDAKEEARGRPLSDSGPRSNRGSRRALAPRPLSQRVLGTRSNSAKRRGLLTQISNRVLRAGQIPTLYCQICLDYVPEEQGFTLTSCGHTFCRDCMVEYVCAEVNSGQIHLMCSWAAGEDPNAAQDGDIETGVGGTCGRPLADADVLELAPPDVATKVARFRMNADPLVRQCPFCDASQKGNPRHPAMTCTSCQKEFCFKHSNAHPTMPCAEYERKHRVEEAMNQAAIAQMSKPCPRCGAAVSKKSGCNQMECLFCKRNGTPCHFCWLCGREVDGGTFPSHYQWWNLCGCPNSQMEGGNGVAWTCFSRVLALILTIALGPPAVLLTIATVALCLPCVMCKFRRQGCRKGWDFIGGIVSFWGYAILFAPCLLPCLPCFAMAMCDAATSSAAKKNQAGAGAAGVPGRGAQVAAGGKGRQSGHAVLAAAAPNQV